MIASKLRKHRTPGLAATHPEVSEKQIAPGAPTAIVVWILQELCRGNLDRISREIAEVFYLSSVCSSIRFVCGDLANL
jgi:hypothetical protein